ncbi:NAD-dependent epimerase/dehydratase family protein [Roseofilum casamattae]|uniref:NAD-dependent epimerase/dehydratase family protein n=1 Tax=Roseofilum casamattae BLCC-M143 TaxID=3022442 RepID=A0ABT7BRU4_9CYAN|nr:NAD-dependent epimerase/dehydratase family protein [Roseofilum casamattae]MDJ1181914.1 NAD-dependent epimerase/dehydratase family protein [Roseofilum casamattae BLCC-M143]
MAIAIEGKRVLLTGVSGFLGRVVCHQLRQHGGYVTGLDKSAPEAKDGAARSNLMLPQDFIQLDLTDLHESEVLTHQHFDVIFHLAGFVYAAHSTKTPVLDFNQNLVATFNLLEALRNSRFSGCLVYASTAAVYGEPRQVPIDEMTPTKPISPYGASKLAAEEYIRVFSQCYGFQSAIARLFSLYGPGQRKQVVFDILCKTLLSDEPIELLGDGCEMRDFVYVNDAARALLLLADLADMSAPIFNICSAKGTTIHDLATLIVTLADRNPDRIVFTGDRRSGDPIHWIGCNKKLLGTGFSLERSLWDGLLETLAWFRTQILAD